jgi:hypothetical protein
MYDNTCVRCGGLVDRLGLFGIKLKHKDDIREIYGHRSCVDKIFNAINNIKKLEKLTVDEVLEILREDGVLKMKTEKCINCEKTFNSDDLERGLCEWCLEYKEGRGDKYEE